MAKVGYNGWKNWETWNVALWASNIEDVYREVRRLRPYTPLKTKLVMQRLYPSGTPDMRSVASRPRGFVNYMETVDWSAIARDWNEE